MRFTKEELQTLILPEGKNEQIWWDSTLPGFGVRLRQGGKPHYLIQFRIGSKQRRLSLGDVRKVELKAVREIARRKFAEILLGSDPAEAKARVKAEQRVSFGSIAARYLRSKESTIKSSTLAQARLHLIEYFKPLNNVPISSLKRADIAAHLQEIAEKRGRVAAQKAKSHLSALFTWSMREGLVEANPVIGTNNPAAGVRSRDRTLGDDELAVIWRSCDGSDFGRIVRLLLLTGMRRTEVGDLRWSEVDLDRGVIALPAERTKNANPHTLILPPLAANILRSCRKRTGDDYVFGFGSGFKSWSGETKRLNKKIAEIGKIAPWRIHDLRRSMRSGLARIGVSDEIGERVLNHVQGGIQGIYNRHRYEREIAEALKIWADHVSAII
jgi:integrase